MTQPPSHRRATVILPFAGLLSGLLAISLPFPDRVSSYCIGALFGVMTMACLWLSPGLRSVWKAIAFIIASVVAYEVAVDATVATPSSFRIFGFHLVAEQGKTAAHIFFTGGLVGAFVVFASALFLFFPAEKSWRVLGKALAWSTLGGVLGVAGWALGSSVGKAFWFALHALHRTAPGEDLQAALDHETPAFYSLFIVWQTGAALILGILLRQAESLSALRLSLEPMQAKRAGLPARLSISGKLFFSCVVAVLTYYVVKEIRS